MFKHYEDTYPMFCKKCGEDVEAKVEDAIDYFRPEDYTPVLVCPLCDETIMDLDEYMEGREPEYGDDI